jgi:hypothetical protein
LQRFAPSSNGEQAEGWNEHRFVRLHVLLTMLEARSPGLVSALSPDLRACDGLLDTPERDDERQETAGV